VLDELDAVLGLIHSETRGALPAGGVVVPDLLDSAAPGAPASECGRCHRCRRPRFGASAQPGTTASEATERTDVNQQAHPVSGLVANPNRIQVRTEADLRRSTLPTTAAPLPDGEPTQENH
jgi:hypothetical protein